MINDFVMIHNNRIQLYKSPYAPDCIIIRDNRESLKLLKGIGYLPIITDLIKILQNNKCGLTNDGELYTLLIGENTQMGFERLASAICAIFKHSRVV
jgi:hypothetical protein